MAFNYRGISSVLGGFIIHLVIGCFYLWGVINIYVTSYYRLHGQTYLNTSLTSGLFPVFLLFVGLTFFFGVRLANKIGLKLACFVESLWMTVAVLLSSFMPDFWSFMVFFAILYGLGSGLLYMVPIYIASVHFPEKKGLVSGVIVAGNGIATLISGEMSQSIINPNNDKPESIDGSKYFPSEIADKVPVFLRYLSLYFFVLSLLGCLLILPKNEKKEAEVTQRLVENPSPSETQNKENSQETKKNEEVGFQEIWDCLKTRDYRLLFLMNALSSGFGLMISVQFKNYGLKNINDDSFLTLIGSISFIFNSIFRVIWGYLMDRLRFKITYWILLACQFSLICSLSTICGYREAYFIWICLILACEGGHFSLFPAITLKQFGTTKGGLVYPYVYFAFVIANFIQFFIILELLDSIEYQNVFWIYAGFTFIAAILNFFFKENDNSKNKE